MQLAALLLSPPGAGRGCHAGPDGRRRVSPLSSHVEGNLVSVKAIVLRGLPAFLSVAWQLEQH